MKRIILMLVLAVTCLVPMVAPSTAQAQVSIEIGDRPYYRGNWYWGGAHNVRYYWVPGHWAGYHHRVWIHGHYVRRDRRYWY
ncbi:MAG: hypothetical protein ACJ8KU_01860 [Chthoniobacterales bacterium]